MKELSRRDALAVGAGAVAITLVPLKAFALSELSMKDVEAFTGGAATSESGKVKIEMPEIAENGNTVPLTVSVESPMTADNHVQSVMVLADLNPAPLVATFNFTPMSGEAKASTRMRLSKTQNVIAYAKMSDGSILSAATQVKVTIGGCGG